jgi:hypothetical protein
MHRHAVEYSTYPIVHRYTAAASVTKSPVTWAVNRPCRPRNPAVSTKPPLKPNRVARPNPFIFDTAAFFAFNQAASARETAV